MSKIQIVGTVRNVEHIILKEFMHVEKIFKNFGQVNTFLVESDSKDKTVKILSELSNQNSNFYFKSLGELDQLIPNRYSRIAYCREVYLNYVKNLQSQVDLVVVVDLDGMNHNLTVEAVEVVLKNQNHWDAVFANQIGRYYDIGALRHPIWSPSDCFSDYNWALKITNEKYARNFGIASKMFEIKLDAGMIPVESAYGGLAIYKAEVFKLSSYIGEDLYGNPILDFVFFNLNLSKKGYKLVIDSRLINCKYNSHNAGSRLLFRILRIASKNIPTSYLKSSVKSFIIRNFLK